MRIVMTANLRDLLAGALFVLIGLAFALNAYFLVDLGSIRRMGPGYFPLMVAATLIGVGLAIAGRSFVRAGEAIGTFPLRGVVLIATGVVVFGLTVRGLGFVPSLVILVAMSAFASRRMTLRLCVMMTAGLVAFCLAVFSLGLGLPLRWFGPWLGGG